MGKFSFKVGKNERHVITYSQSKLTGKTEVMVDGEAILSKYVLLGGSGSIMKFKVGNKKIHEVEIIKKTYERKNIHRISESV